jgi:hypothetical protein
VENVTTDAKNAKTTRPVPNVTETELIHQPVDAQLVLGPTLKLEDVELMINVIPVSEKPINA